MGIYQRLSLQIPARDPRHKFTTVNRFRIKFHRVHNLEKLNPVKKTISSKTSRQNENKT